MDIKRSELKGHAAEIGRVIASVCSIKLQFPLIGSASEGEEIVLTITSMPKSSLLQRPVTTDLGLSENVLGLPIPDASRPKFWLGLNESWEHSGKYKLTFKQCGIRIYVGEADEESRQFLRLEWVAPTVTREVVEYQGGHAGHPHWHVDRAALVGPSEHFRSLEILTRPNSQEDDLEIFDSNSTVPTDEFVPDLSWFCGVHLTAQSEWMNQRWDGTTLPAPHQCMPKGQQMLASWWDGSLRYIFAELVQHYQ